MDWSCVAEGESGEFETPSDAVDDPSAVEEFGLKVGDSSPVKVTVRVCVKLASVKVSLTLGVKEAVSVKVEESV